MRDVLDGCYFIGIYGFNINLTMAVVRYSDETSDEEGIDWLDVSGKH